MMILDGLLRLLYPTRCIFCREPLPAGQLDFCHKCRVEADRVPTGKNPLPYLAGWTAVWYYEGAVRDSLLRFKFYGKRSYGNAYGRALAMKLSQDFPQGFDLLTWVPVSSRRRFRRGYDQVQILAKAVGRELSMKPQPLLRKVRHNPPQSTLRGLAARRANVTGAFRIRNPDLIAGKRILLLDDLITTGATAGECARVLLTAGAREVYCGAVATVRRNPKNR